MAYWEEGKQGHGTGTRRSSPGARALRALCCALVSALGEGVARGARQGRKGRLRHGFHMRSEQARIGARVMVGNCGRRSEGRGLTGTVTQKWGDPTYLALDVLLEDGRTQLFWHHELEDIDARGA